MPIEVLSRPLPLPVFRRCDVDAPHDALCGRAGQNVAAALNRLGALRHVADSDVRNSKDAALLLHGSTVRQHTERLLLQSHEVRKTERFDEPGGSTLLRKSERLHPT